MNGIDELLKLLLLLLLLLNDINWLFPKDDWYCAPGNGAGWPNSSSKLAKKSTLVLPFLVEALDVLEWVGVLVGGSSLGWTVSLGFLVLTIKLILLFQLNI